MKERGSVFALRSITFGFSDSEDRLWMRLVVVDHPDVQYWVTRRFILRWHDSIVDALFDTVQVGQPPAPHLPEVCAALEYNEALYGEAPALALAMPSATVSVNVNSSTVPPQQAGLLNQMEISANSSGMTLTFVSREETLYRFGIDRFSSYRLLQVLRDQMKNASWDQPIATMARRGWCEESFIGHLKTQK